MTMRGVGGGVEGGGSRVCSNNPDHKVDMIAQGILKVPSLTPLGALEFQCPNILTYLMNVSCMDGMKIVYCPLCLFINYAPHPPTLSLCTQRHPMCRLKIPSVV